MTYTETSKHHKGCIPAPLWVVEAIEGIIGRKFELDAAASPDNAKAPRYWTKEDDGLVQPWDAKTVWVNPPWHQEYLTQWIEKAYRTAKETGAIVACALPGCTRSERFDLSVRQRPTGNQRHCFDFQTGRF